MQNLTLPTSQVLALGATFNAIDSVKSTANNNTSAEPNNSFEMMLKKQVKAQKETVQDKTTQQHAAHKNSNKKAIVDEKKSQLNTEQADKNNQDAVQVEQGDDELDNNISISQMLADAKALLLDSKKEELSSNGAVNNQGESVTSTLIAIPPNSAATSIIQNVNLSTTSVEESRFESNNSQLKTSFLPQVTESKGKDISTTDLSEDQLDLVDGNSLSQERLQWASVSASKSDQNAKLSNELVNSKVIDGSQFQETLNNLNVITHQPQQAKESNAILSTQSMASSNQIHAYPGKTGWDQAISQKIVWMVGAAEQTATLSLNPPELGPLQVVINVQNDKADTTFISNNAEVRQALQDGMANLREKMAESGIQLGQTNVNSGGRPQQEFQSSDFNQQTSKQIEKGADLSTPATAQTARISHINKGLVDTFA